jgi:hypothetical protein
MLHGPDKILLKIHHGEEISVNMSPFTLDHTAFYPLKP